MKWWPKEHYVLSLGCRSETSSSPQSSDSTKYSHSYSDTATSAPKCEALFRPTNYLNHIERSDDLLDPFHPRPSTSSSCDADGTTCESSDVGKLTAPPPMCISTALCNHSSPLHLSIPSAISSYLVSWIRCVTAQLPVIHHQGRLAKSRTQSCSTTSSEMAATGALSPQNFGRHSKHSTTGCWTCKSKKIKCDEERPICNICVRLHRICDYEPRQRKPYARTSRVREGESTRHDQSSPGDIETQDAVGLSAMRTVTVDKRRHQMSEATPDAGDLSLCLLSPPGVPAACSLVLGPQEREAIDYFRTTFSRYQHTKSPSYSVVSVIFHIATKSASAMHMAVSIGRREMLCVQSNGQIDVDDDDTAILHYSAALRKVAEFVNGSDTETGLDTILATIWLMLSYEQKFGDGEGRALSSHLRGLASIIQHKARHALLLPADQDHHTPSSATTIEWHTPPQKVYPPSLFSARMLVWISLLDAGAASTGLGGDFNASLHGLLEEHAHRCDGCDPRLQTNLFRSYTQMQKYSNPLFCKVWGDDYPVSEIMDDLDNHEIFLLYGQCFQLRYMSSRLYDLKMQESDVADDCENVIELAFAEASERYAEFILLASKLNIDTDHSLRAIKNLRFIVPHYHAAILYYARCASPDRVSKNQRTSATNMIRELAFQAFKYEGDEAMLRIAWPLFMAVLETDDQVHREWLSTRLQALGKFGKNYARAAVFAEWFTAEKTRGGGNLDFRQALRSRQFEQFSI